MPITSELWVDKSYTTQQLRRYNILWSENKKKRVICMVMEHVCGRADQLLRAKLFDFIQRKNLLDFGKFTNAS